MNIISPVSIDKSADYQNKIQASFTEKINSINENNQKSDDAFASGQVVKVEISAMGAEELEKVRQSWNNQPVSALYRSDIPVNTNNEGVYRVGKVDFSEEEFEAARNLVTGMTSQLKQGTLSYKDYTKMAMAENLVQKCASTTFSKEQSEVIAKAMKDYNERLTNRNNEMLSNSRYVKNDTDSDNHYWGIRGAIPEEAKDAMQSLFGRKPGAATSVTNIATNQELIDNLQKMAKEIKTTEKDGQEQFKTLYQSVMKPAYDTLYPDEMKSDSQAAIEIDLNGSDGIMKLVDFAKQWMGRGGR